MNVIRDEEFEDQEVILDFNHFRNCRFEGCTLIYHGHGDSEFTDCNLVESNFSMRGPASKALDYLDSLRKTAFAQVPFGIAQQLLGNIPFRVAEVDGEQHLILDAGKVPDENMNEVEALIEHLAGPDVEAVPHEDEEDE